MSCFFKAFPDITLILGNALKKLFDNNRMSTYAELMEILKANEIRGYSHYSKSKLIDLLIKRGLIPVKYGTSKEEKQKQRRILILSIIFKADTQQSKEG